MIRVINRKSYDARNSERMNIDQKFLQDKQDFVLIKRAIESNQFLEALNKLKELSKENVENPILYNLYGILFEKKGDRQRASKFYRVAYYMHQSFHPANQNLGRVCSFLYDGFCDVQWGFEE